jgi:hypothetical protein
MIFIPSLYEVIRYAEYVNRSVESVSTTPAEFGISNRSILNIFKDKTIKARKTILYGSEWPFHLTPLTKS